MNQLLNLYKPQGFTPFEIVEQLREKRPELAHEKIGYAGRLDPLAHGVLLLMIGEANKDRDLHIGLNKTYEFTVLFGLQTDSYDYMGVLKDKIITNPPMDLQQDINNFIKTHTGHVMQTYPPFSSKTIDGVTLFNLAKKGELQGKKMPSREVTIDVFTCLSIDTIMTKDLKEMVVTNINKVKGDFRQKEILAQWEEVFTTYPEETFTTAKFSLACSSGTYVRSLANEMGEIFGCGAIAIEILRTKVGEHELKDSVRL